MYTLCRVKIGKRQCVKGMCSRRDKYEEVVVRGVVLIHDECNNEVSQEV